MIKMINPAARAGANRVLNINALTGVDVRDPIETRNEFQSETLAVKTVMNRFHVSIWHAQVICRLSGLGGAA